MEVTNNSAIPQIIQCDEIVVNILKNLPIKSFFNFVTTCKNLNNRKFTLLRKLMNEKKELTFKKDSIDLSLIRTIKTLNKESFELEISYNCLNTIYFDENAFPLTNLLQVVKNSKLTTLTLKLESNSEDNLRLETIKQIAINVGTSLEKLYLDSTNDFKATLIFLEHCPHLKKLSIGGVYKILEVIETATTHLTQLKGIEFNRPFDIVQDIPALRITEENSSLPLENFIKKNKKIQVLILNNIPFSLETAVHIINCSNRLNKFPLHNWNREDAEDLLTITGNSLTLSIGEPTTIISQRNQAIVDKKVLLKEWPITIPSPHIESLTIESEMNLTSEEIITTVNNCQNLKSLNIKKTNITEENLNQMTISYPKLKTLTLNNCHKVKGSFVCENNKSIETLHLESILTTNNMFSCTKETEALTKTITNCTSLKNLTLISIRSVTNEMIEALLKQNSLIQTLTVVNCYQVDEIIINHEMTHLTKFVFNPPGIFTEEITINAHCPNLKEIHFNSGSHNPIFSLNNNCPHLEKLNLSDTKLNWKQIKPIIDNCKEVRELHLNKCNISFENAKTILTESPSLEFVCLPSFTKQENRILKNLAATHHCNLI